jgi:hypothetical protein
MYYRFWIQRRLVLLLILTYFANGLVSQEMWGITTGNFAGSNGTLLNPSGIATSKLYLDINLATADAFFSNNYLFIHAKDYSLFRYLRRDPEFPKYGPDEMPFDRYDSKIPKIAYVSLSGRGPSFMLARGRHAFAFHTGVKVLTSLTNAPYHIANFGYFGLDYEEQHNINYRSENVKVASLSYGEVGISYAYAFRKYNMDDWSAGITVKSLFGIASAYLNAEDLNYTVVNDSTIDVKNMNGKFGFSIPLDYTNNDYPDPGSTIKGGGFGFDIGVTYQRKVMTYQSGRFTSYCSQRYIDYIYKIGVSLLDIGYVRFNNNAQLHSYDNVSRYWYNVDTVSYLNMNQLMQSLSQVFYNDPGASYRGDRITVYLPAAFSLQFDYKLYQNWYVGGVFIHSLPVFESQVVRPAQVMVAARYETPVFEASIPVSLYEWRYPRVGLSARYHFLTIGTDNLASLLGFTDFTGLDFYVSIKVNFRKGKCLGRGRELECPNFEYGVNRKK